jgi:CDP-diacylglycerol--glycerol-3-phosphate 3-phosphatidyltransferase
MCRYYTTTAVDRIAAALYDARMTEGSPETNAAKTQPAVQRVSDRVVVKTCLWAFPHWIKPNHLTILRLLFVPVILMLLYFHHRGWALGMFCVATATDLIDGAMARERRQTSTFGTYVDPIADKLLVGAVLAWVGWPYQAGWPQLIVPIFLAAIVLELIVTAVGVPMLVKAQTNQSSNLFGKGKMFTQSLGLFLFLLAGILELHTLKQVSMYLLWLAFALAVISGAMQVFDAAKKRKEQSQGE